MTECQYFTIWGEVLRSILKDKKVNGMLEGFDESDLNLWSTKMIKWKKIKIPN